MHSRCLGLHSVIVHDNHSNRRLESPRARHCSSKSFIPVFEALGSQNAVAGVVAQLGTPDTALQCALPPASTLQASFARRPPELRATVCFS